MNWPGDCAECEKPLNALDIKYGWVTINLGYGRPDARVHTICRGKFNERSWDDQVARARKVNVAP